MTVPPLAPPISTAARTLLRDVAQKTPLAPQGGPPAWLGGSLLFLAGMVVPAVFYSSVVPADWPEEVRRTLGLLVTVAGIGGILWGLWAASPRIYEIPALADAMERRLSAHQAQLTPADYAEVAQSVEPELKRGWLATVLQVLPVAPLALLLMGIFGMRIAPLFGIAVPENPTDAELMRDFALALGAGGLLVLGMNHIDQRFGQLRAAAVRELALRHP